MVVPGRVPPVAPHLFDVGWRNAAVANSQKGGGGGGGGSGGGGSGGGGSGRPPAVLSLQLDVGAPLMAVATMAERRERAVPVARVLRLHARASKGEAAEGGDEREGRGGGGAGGSEERR